MLLRSLLDLSDNEIKSDLKKDKCILGQELIDDKTSIRIRCMWDSTISHDDVAEPMYKTWEHDGYGTINEFLLKYVNYFSILDEGHMLVANALITDEHSTVTGK